MGLNFVKRGKREELDPPNDFIAAALGETDIEMKHNDEHLIYDYYNERLDRVQEKYDDLDFTR